MQLIENNDDLKAFCAQEFPAFITVDTEFMREKTYYPQLCLVQVAGEGITPVAIDPLAKGLDLAPLLKILADKNILKVFHAPKQDLEIFYQLMDGKLPTPIFDTQVAASVLGYGDQIGYNTLVQQICAEEIDKSRQFTNWALRPLSEAQIKYAIGDVTYLITLYIKLSADLKKQKRLDWIEEEMKILSDPKTYKNDPQEAWKRIKIRSGKRLDYIALKAVAAWREQFAQDKDIPKTRIMRDEVIAQLAMIRPTELSQLTRIRSLPDHYKTGHHAAGLLKVIKQAIDTADTVEIDLPLKNPRPAMDISAILDMLKLLLKLNAHEHGLAAKMIANSDDLEQFALGNTEDLALLKGWRYKVFGQDAENLLQGKLMIGLQKGKIIKNLT
jgi:ribonuclease D